jgi:hypothetical protein
MDSIWHHCWGCAFKHLHLLLGVLADTDADTHCLGRNRCSYCASKAYKDRFSAYSGRGYVYSIYWTGRGERGGADGRIASGLWLMEMFIARRRFQFIRSRAVLPVILLLVISFIAFWMGRLPWFVFADQAPLDSQLGGLAIFLFSLG